MDIREYLRVMLRKEASDVYLTANSPAMYRVQGSVKPEGESILANDQLEELALSLMNERQASEFEKTMEMNLALFYPDLGRFRVNIYRQRGNIGIVIREIKLEMKTAKDLHLPELIDTIAMTKRGLVLVVGPTGCGKSTTLAAMINHRNANSHGHIITIEDPIEFVHQNKKSIVSQREIGFDTHSYNNALKNALRQAPDVILVGEIRDTESMEAAITFADTGHLCLATLHSTNAHQCMERIINFFPETRHPQLFMQLSLNLRSIISQRLVPSTDGKRVPAVEILMDTPRIKDLIKKGEIDILRDAMEQSIQEGCQTFDQALFVLYKDGKISLEQALAFADSVNNLRLKIKMEGIKGDEALDRLLAGDGKQQPKTLQVRGGHPGNPNAGNVRKI